MATSSWTGSNPTSRSGPRFWLVGSSGSGKSSLGKKLAELYTTDFVELDSIYHQANWQPVDASVLREQVSELVSRDKWIIDGNYKQVSELIKSRATTVIFLDLPLRTLVPRIIKRSLRRIFGRKELWNGNRETLGSILSPRPKHNVLLWAVLRFRERRRIYLHPDFLSGQVRTNLVVLHNQQEIDRYFQFLSNGI